jgi:hypothetical protein
MLKSGSSWNLVPLPASSTKGGERGVLKAPRLDYEEGQLFSYSILHQTWVSTPSKTFLVLGQATGNTDSLDSPRPEVGGSHHLPPYSILCVTPRHPHPNGFYSQDSQGGVPKLSGFGLPRLWELITPSSDLGLGWDLKQTCSSPQDISNGVLHSICTHRDWVDSWLFVVGSQTGNLTPGPSFAHNLCFRCPNVSCEAIFDIYTSRPFQQYKEHVKARFFAFFCRALKLQESRRTPNSHFWECESCSHLPQSGVATGLQVPTFGSANFILTLASKWGCDIFAPI